MSIRAVVIDMGGVIVRTDDKGPRDRLAERLGLTREQINAIVFDSPTARLATVGKYPVEEHWKWLCQTFHMQPDKANELEREFFAGDSVDMQLVDFMRGLRPRYTTALLSNAWSGLREKLDAQWGIIDAFDQVVISAEVGLAKPDPRIFELTLDRLHAAAGETVFIDDFPENIAAAAAAGLHAVRFVDTDQTISEVKALLKD